MDRAMPCRDEGGLHPIAISSRVFLYREREWRVLVVGLNGCVEGGRGWIGFVGCYGGGVGFVLCVLVATKAVESLLLL